ncbi:MAG: hypothetical protein M3010_10225 [Candidatus Dormibacteraeota bacterium]|nr:hypothetical protein [Candidatus Dormibacteraeota bacterium]
MADSALATRRAGGPRKIPYLALLAVSVALNLALAGVLVVVKNGPGSSSADTAGPAIAPSAWTAVFLTNNQPAFVGHLKSVSASELAVDDVWYLTYLANDGAGKPIASPRPEDFKPVLCQVGASACGQLYGSRNFVRVNRQNVLYYTELKPDSNVVQSILKFEKPAPQPAPSR